MNLYKTAPHQPFLETVADFVLSNFHQNIDQVKIIVPTRLMANNLQKIITNRKQSTLLPDIIPYSNITPTSYGAFSLPVEMFNILSPLEERVILAEMINNYLPFGYNFTQSLQLSPLLAELFHDIDLNKFDISNIKNLPMIDQAQHWRYIYNFLDITYKDFHTKIKELGKVTCAIHQINALKTLDDKFLIIAGFIGDNQTAWDFISNRLNSGSNNYLILPPLPASIEKILSSASSEDFYALRSLLNSLNKNITDFHFLDAQAIPTILDNLIGVESSTIRTQVHSTNHDITHIACDNIFEEGETIAAICQGFASQNIGIIICNDKVQKYYEVFLTKYNLKFQSLLGTPLIKTKICEFIFSVSKFLCHNFCLKNLFILLKNPILVSEEVFDLERLLLGNNRFVTSFEQLLKIVQNKGQAQLIAWVENLILTFKTFTYSSDKFNELLSSIINIAQALVRLNSLSFRQDEFKSEDAEPRLLGEHSRDLQNSLVSSLMNDAIPNLWNKDEEGAEELSNILRDVIEYSSYLGFKDLNEFYIILKTLLSGTKKFEHIDGANILLCYPHEAIYSKFDIVIFADFNSNSWPPEEKINPWLNKKMQADLNLPMNQIQTASYLYNFYLLLHNPKIFITRFKMHESKELLPSNYLNKLLHIMPQLKLLKKFVAPCPLKLDSGSSQIFELEVLSQVQNNNLQFPSSISATDIELLVRSPYSFYIKKILGLKKTEHINTKPKLSEFGNFIHSVIEEYSKNYAKLGKDKLQAILDIGRQVLEALLLPQYARNSWQTKFINIAPEFIIFDEKRRDTGTMIYSEIKGVANLNILGHNIAITARADRIEVDTAGGIAVLDYKTGALPTKKDVFSGLSPQLIISSIIAMKNGFTEIRSSNIRNMIYVKIASSKPYIQILELEITTQELVKHEDALVKLLEYYITTKNFSSRVNLLKYNDYKHFIREYTG